MRGAGALKSLDMPLQGQSLPLWGTVGQLMDQLTAAGVGQRPVVFVCHRSVPKLNDAALSLLQRAVLPHIPIAS